MKKNIRDYYKNYYKNHKKEKDARQWMWYRNHPKKYLLRLARKRAQRLGIKFDLREEDFEVPKYCPVLGIKLQFNFGKGSGGRDNSFCLDRINNKRGYVNGNIVVMSHKANRIKSNSTMKDIEKLLMWYKEKLAKRAFKTEPK